MLEKTDGASLRFQVGLHYTVMWVFIFGHVRNKLDNLILIMASTVWTWGDITDYANGLV